MKYWEVEVEAYGFRHDELVVSVKVLVLLSRYLDKGVLLDVVGGCKYTGKGEMGFFLYLGASMTNIRRQEDHLGS